MLCLGEKKIPIMSAIRFVKLLFQYKQQDAFSELAGEMLQVLSVSRTLRAPQLSLFTSMCVVAVNHLVSLCLAVSGCGRSIIQEGRDGTCFT